MSTSTIAKLSMHVDVEAPWSRLTVVNGISQTNNNDLLEKDGGTKNCI